MSYFTDFVRGFFRFRCNCYFTVGCHILCLAYSFEGKIGTAFRSGLTMEVWLLGIFLVIDLLVKNLGPAAQAMVKNFRASV